MKTSLTTLAATALFTVLVAIPRSAIASDAEQILAASGVHGGLVVHLGCGDGKLTAALGTGREYLVVGLDTNADHVAAARQNIQVAGLYGRVSADTFDGRRIPFSDDTVNLLLVEESADVGKAELLRALAPEGVALVHSGGRWDKLTKPWPDDIDEWTHYLHDASNNAVAHDDRIGPPVHLQWQCGPRWSRHHDHMASVSAMVSARGRMFYILDEGSRVSPQLPADWKLVARDAFNGVLLWKRPIGQWHDALWPLKSGPASLPRRLVAVDQVVYATLGIEAEVTALDATSGETLQSYAGSNGAEEIIHNDSLLLVLVNRTPMDMEADLAVDAEEGKSRDSRTTYSDKMARIWAGVRSPRWTNGDRSIVAFDAHSGRRLWEHRSRVIPLTLASDQQGAYFHDGDKVVALDLATGRPRWESEPVPVWQGLQGQGLQSWFAPTLVVQDGTVLMAGGEKTHMSYMGWGSDDIGQDTMTALSSDTGRKLWTADHPYSGYNSPEDLFVADGKVWTGVTAKSGPGGRYTGRDLASGDVKLDFPPTIDAHWFHHRCYRAKATDKYVLCSRTGIEFVDLATGEWTINHWVRGGCLYGIMPANGLVYSPPHPCACYPEAKLYGFTALAAARESQALPEEIPTEGRLQKGPAYGALIPNPQSLVPSPTDWPTYRHNAARSGATPSSLPERLQEAWQIELKGRLSQPVAADGRVFVAAGDRHMVYAVDAASGKRLWSFTAGGRIDSPPTCSDGSVLFGSADGHVYSVRASDGHLAWRFRAAPVDRRMVAFDQVESAWPVHGSVLVDRGVATVVAGRSMYLDGGLRLCRLDVETGSLIGEKVLDDRDPVTGENMQVQIKGLNMPTALTDILSSDGEHLFMRSLAMDLEGNRIEPAQGSGGIDHLFAAYGFTDDSWFHRTYWLYGDSFKGGVGGFSNGKSKPAGRIMANNDTTVFGYGRKPDFYRWCSVVDYQLYAVPKPGGTPVPKQPKKIVAGKRTKGESRQAYLWTRDLPIMVRAMALADNTLLVAGPADLLDELSAFQSFGDEATQAQIALQDAALKGQSGALLQTVDATTGETTAEYRLDSPPVFDGLIVAAGSVFITTTNGRLIALK